MSVKIMTSPTSVKTYRNCKAVCVCVRVREHTLMRAQILGPGLSNILTEQG